MDRKEFDRELAAYIRKRRSKKLRLPAIFRKRVKPDKEEQASSVIKISGKRGIIQKIIESIMGARTVRVEEQMQTEQEFDSMDSQYQEQKGVFKKLSRLFRKDKKQAEFQQELNQLEKEEIKLEKQEMRIEEKKISKMFKFFKKFGTPKGAAPKEPSREAELYQELKELAKTTTEIIKKLPEEQMQMVKRTREFARFKEILQKNGLIKDKPPAQEASQ